MCVYKTEDGKCTKFSDEETTSYCVEGPCEYEKLSNYDRIKAMSVDELAEFLELLLDGENNHNVACYGCMNYGTHHSDPKNKENGLYECGDCYNEGIGLDLVKWLKKEASENERI